MQADMDVTVNVRLEGTMAKLLIKMDPKLYRKYVRNERGKTVLYVELLKALYKTLRAALLFWKLFLKKLVEWGFGINPYDWWVANKTVNGKQCKILWHVDDLKISHVDPDVVTDMIKTIDKDFGQEAPIKVRRGKMLDYVDGMLVDLPVDMAGESATPAADHLFQVNTNDPIKLDKEKSQHYVEK